MTISALYILDLKGKIIISRDYRGDISVNYVERFVSKVLEEEESNLKPIFEEDGVTYIYVKHNNLYCKLLIFKIFFWFIFKFYLDA